MIQYLVILLDDTSVSFCHYGNAKKERRLMPLETLEAGILFGMKENLNIQFVYPAYALPEAYNKAVERVAHVKIKPAAMPDNADVVVMDGWEECESWTAGAGVSCVLRLPKAEWFGHAGRAAALLEKAERLNVVLTDVETFTEDDFKAYEASLQELAGSLAAAYASGKTPQLNLLTDRMMLDKMNNCGAGDTNITLAPDGKFYVCPAFYQAEGGYAIGSLAGGLDIKNAQLYRLDHAPLCRHCDAYQCRRCVWLNRKTTCEANTPGHEQCVVAHLERNASRQLLLEVRKQGTFLPDKEEIREINYLDPFEIRKEW